MNAETVKQENQEDLSKKEGQEEVVEKIQPILSMKKNLIAKQRRLNKDQLLSVI